MSNDRLEIIDDKARSIATLVAELMSVGTFAPELEPQFGWRHPERQKNVYLFCLTKLAGAASSINAAVLLGKSGYWFQVAVLARTITESLLSIAYVLPRPETAPGGWPNQKQQDAIKEHFMETWSNPREPFRDQRQRPVIKELSAANGSFQSKDGTLTPSDGTAAALQMMRMLSDYTHVAYPQVMELLQAGKGYVLTGGQSLSAFTEGDLGHLLGQCGTYACTVSELLRKCYAQIIALAEGDKVETHKLDGVRRKLDAITQLAEEFEQITNTLDKVFPSPNGEIAALLKQYRGRGKS